MTKREQQIAIKRLCSDAKEATKLLREILELTDKIDLEMLTLEERERIHMAASDVESLHETTTFIADLIDMCKTID